MNNWQHILKSVNYPTTAVTLDFETYTDKEYNIRNMSTVEYVTDKRFDLLGLGIFESLQLFDDPKNCIFWAVNKVSGRIKRLQEEYGENLEKCTIVGQHLPFDCLILKHHFDILPKYTVDILDLARHEDARRHNRLEDLCKYYKTSVQKDDIKQFFGLHYSQMYPGKKVDLANYCKTDVIAETELFRFLLPKLTNPVCEIPLAHHTLLMFLRPLLNFDFDLANVLISEMEDELHKILRKVKWISSTDLLDDVIHILRSQEFIIKLKSVLPVDEKIPTKIGKKGQIFAGAKTDDGFQYLLRHPVEKVRDLAQARLASKSWPSHILRIKSMINQAKAQDSKIAVPIRYYGAHTGRWSGSEGINLQNLPGTGRAGSGTHPLLQKIRGLLIAPLDYILSIVDLSQIECRVLAWFAEQDDLVKDFAEEKDIYSQSATELFGHLVRKKKDSDPPPVVKRFTIERGFGKDEVLGCGFGMGASKFYDRCYANSNLKPLFDNSTYNMTFIEKIIQHYRHKYTKIVKFWRDIEKAFRWVIKYPNQYVWLIFNGKEFEWTTDITTGDYAGTNKCILHFYNINNTVYIQLPSSRCLRYPHSRITGDNKISWKWGKLWGGFIVENIVQAASRDIMAEAILKIEANNIPVVLHSHDEIVGCVPKNNAEQSLQFMIDTMCTNPAWATGLPINAEGELSEKYKK